MAARSTLKVILVQEDVSIKELAAAAEMPYATVQRIVTSGRRPQYDNAYDLIDGLNRLTRKRYKLDDVFPNQYKYGEIKKRRTI
jgi:predicted transcriptional regulator